MKAIKHLLPLFIILYCLAGCAGPRYYRKVSRHTSEFLQAMDEPQVQAVHSLATNGIQCVYASSVKGTPLYQFMSRYNLDRICLRPAVNDNPDSVITFHRYYNFLWGDAIIIYYDFGKSNLRQRMGNGLKVKREKFRPIDSAFFYYEHKKPAF